MGVTANDAIVELERYFRQTYVECVDREVSPLSAGVIQYAIEAIQERDEAVKPKKKAAANSDG